MVDDVLYYGFLICGGISIWRTFTARGFDQWGAVWLLIGNTMAVADSWLYPANWPGAWIWRGYLLAVEGWLIWWLWHVNRKRRKRVAQLLGNKARAIRAKLVGKMRERARRPARRLAPQPS